MQVLVSNTKHVLNVIQSIMNIIEIALRTAFVRHFTIADISKEKWEEMTLANNWNSVELRDNRYNHIVHMVSAANGAEVFYSTEVSVLSTIFDDHNQQPPKTKRYNYLVFPYRIMPADQRALNRLENWTIDQLLHGLDTRISM